MPETHAHRPVWMPADDTHPAGTWCEDCGERVGGGVTAQQKTATTGWYSIKKGWRITFVIVAVIVVLFFAELGTGTHRQRSTSLRVEHALQP